MPTYETNLQGYKPLKIFFDGKLMESKYYKYNKSKQLVININDRVLQRIYENTYRLDKHDNLHINIKEIDKLNK